VTGPPFFMQVVLLSTVEENIYSREVRMEAKLREPVQISSRYAEMLSSFDDDLQSAVDLALQRYLIDQVTAKIAGLRKQDRTFRLKYDCDYKTFFRRTAEDEAYVVDIENKISKVWEADLADWEFCSKGIDDWLRESLPPEKIE